MGKAEGARDEVTFLREMCRSQMPVPSVARWEGKITLLLYLPEREAVRQSLSFKAEWVATRHAPDEGSTNSRLQVSEQPREKGC